MHSKGFDHFFVVSDEFIITVISSFPNWIRLRFTRLHISGYILSLLTWLAQKSSIDPVMF